MVSRRDLLRNGGALATLAAFGTEGSWAQQSGKTITISTTGLITGSNPYAHSSSHLYSVWAQVYGTLTRYDYVTKQLRPMLATSWKSVEPTRWRLTLDRSRKRNDGGAPVSSADVVHAFERIRKDPATQQTHRLVEVKAVEPIDDATLDIVTRTPFATFPSDVLPYIVITSAELSKQHGNKVDLDAPHGWGPYMLDRVDIDNRIVLRRSPQEAIKKDRPDVAIIRQILEPEQRVTAILNNEIQIARLIPPQMQRRVKGQQGVDLIESPGLEYMFLTTNVKHEPWGDVRVRQAMAHAINRKLIVDRLLFKLADLFDSAIGPSQDCHAADPGFPAYDPARAKALLAEAGHAGGLAIDFYTASGRYVADRQIGEAIAQMLNEVGFRVNLIAPDYAAFTTMVQKGECPFYYTGRAGTNNPLENLPLFYQTGASKRVQYSNPKLDEVFGKARSEFDSGKYCGLMQEASTILQAEAPTLFMWTHRLLQAKRSNISWTPDAYGEVWIDDVAVA